MRTVWLMFRCALCKEKTLFLGVALQEIKPAGHTVTHNGAILFRCTLKVSSMKIIALLALATAAATVSVPAAAQFAKAEEAIKYRQSSFTVLGQHFGRLGAMVNGKMAFDAKAAQENADIVAMMAKLPAAGFGPGTDHGAPTKAKPEIWTEQAKFKEYGDKMEAETAKLAVAARTGHLDAIKAAFGDAAKTCKTCHDAYRNK